MSRELLARFYEGFKSKDPEEMAACYADDVVFSDPVYPHLVGERARNMWRMLAGRAKDLTLDYEIRSASDSAGQVHWEARYTFSQTGRKVHNVIDARLEMKDGRIEKHTDVFDFWRWSRQALGPTGLLLGWSPILKNKVRNGAAQALDEFSAKRKSPPRS
jgi:ketosteroid isomerase-like protein